MNPQQLIAQIQQLEHEKKALLRTCTEQLNAVLSERVVSGKLEAMVNEQHAAIQQLQTSNTELQKQIDDLKNATAPDALAE